MTHESEGLPGIYKARQKANAVAMKDKPLPCPFCGEKKQIYTNKIVYWSVLCVTCGVDGPTNRTEKGAIKAWNRRSK